MSEQERRLRYMADELDEQMRRSGVLLDEPELVAYLQGIVDRLFPELEDELTVFVHRSPDANAFMTPSGSLYMFAGFLARLDSEAQLAAVLGHEGVHYTHRHSVQSIRKAKSDSAAGMLIGLAIGVPIAGTLLAGTSYSGFSRDLEREADEIGFQRMRAAGYTVDDAHVAFERMAREAQVLKRRDGSLFASHPKLTERIATMKALAAAAPGEEGEYGRERYLETTQRMRMNVLADLLAQRQALTLILMLDEQDMLRHYPPEARFYLADAYRQRNERGDAERAEEHYLLAAHEAPEFAPTWRALGLHYMRSEQPEQALAAFEKFLELDQDAPDRAFIEQYAERFRQTVASTGDET